MDGVAKDRAPEGTEPGAGTQHQPPAEVAVDLSAVTANVAALRQHVGARQHAGGPQVMAVVKSDGYGHGMVAAARAALAGGASWLGVISVAEALTLREAGLTTPVLCLMAVPGAAHEQAIQAGVDLPAGTVSMVNGLAAAAKRAGRPARVHLKADTGMSRGGATAADWPGVVAAARAAEAAGTIEIVGLWSHLACADLPGHPANEAQVAAFAEAIAVAERAGVRPQVRHLANTPATLSLPGTWFDLVRPGGGIFGLDLRPGPAPGWLRPAMTVRSRLIQVKRVAPGTGVSYGHRYHTPAAGTLGLVPLGYADGVPRAASGRVQVQVHGRRWPIAGSVCMNQFIVDFGAEPVAEGDPVVLFGPGDAGEPTAREWAEALGTISYEVVTSVGRGLPRSYYGVAYDGPVPGGGGTAVPGEIAAPPA